MQYLTKTFYRTKVIYIDILVVAGIYDRLAGVGADLVLGAVHQSATSYALDHAKLKLYHQIQWRNSSP
jgi:hypothetical protein